MIRKATHVNGKYVSATGKTESEALKNLARKIIEIERGEDTIDGNMTVDSWYKKWKSTYKDPKGLTPKSLGMYDEKYNNHIKPQIGHMKISSVRDVHLQKILNGEAGKSESHLKKIRIVLQGMFRQARISRVIAIDPSECLEIPKSRKGARRSITDEEREAILELAKTHRSGLWVLTLLYTGMRPGETAVLTWNDVDFDNNEIHVHAAKESGSDRVKGPKTSAGYRDIPMRSELRERLLEAQGEPFSLVFPTKAGSMMNESAMRRRWRSFKEELGESAGSDITPYCLRHTFCTDLQKAGVPINVAKELMGHSDIQTTANIYTHRDNGVLHAQMALLEPGVAQAVAQRKKKTLDA